MQTSSSYAIRSTSSVGDPDALLFEQKGHVQLAMLLAADVVTASSPVRNVVLLDVIRLATLVARVGASLVSCTEELVGTSAASAREYGPRR